MEEKQALRNEVAWLRREIATQRRVLMDRNENLATQIRLQRKEIRRLAIYH